LNPQAFWAPAPKAGVFAISPLPHDLAQEKPGRGGRDFGTANSSLE
jgi:hypothetical protein